jgi:hypothetical protein
VGVLEMADFAGMTLWLMPMYTDTYLICIGTLLGYWNRAALFIAGKVAIFFSLAGWFLMWVGYMGTSSTSGTLVPIHLVPVKQRVVWPFGKYWFLGFHSTATSVPCCC